MKIITTTILAHVASASTRNKSPNRDDSLKLACSSETREGDTETTNDGSEREKNERGILLFAHLIYRVSQDLWY